MSTEDPIAHACRLLREAASDLQKNSTYSLHPDDWRGETEAKAAFDEYMALADALEAAAVQEPVATVFTMEALAPGGHFKYHATVHKPLPAGTKLYAHPQPAAQDAERIQALELEVRQLTEQIAELRGGAAYSLPEWLEVMHASEIRGIWNDCKRDGLHYVAFAWRIERLGWQRLLDALRSSRGKAPAQQPAPSAAPAEADGWCAHYLPCECAPEAREGCVSWRNRKPSPTPQADSQPALELAYPPLPDFDSGDDPIWEAIFKWKTATPGADAYGKANAVESAIIDQLRAYVDADRAARALADSVLEDAALIEKIAAAIRDYYYALDTRAHGGTAASRAVTDIARVLGMRWEQGKEAAARKQGANHD